jgi:hypothetical protein
MPAGSCSSRGKKRWETGNRPASQPWPRDAAHRRKLSWVNPIVEAWASCRLWFLGSWLTRREGSQPSHRTYSKGGTQGRFAARCVGVSGHIQTAPPQKVPRATLRCPVHGCRPSVEPALNSVYSRTSATGARCLHTLMVATFDEPWLGANRTLPPPRVVGSKHLLTGQASILTTRLLCRTAHIDALTHICARSPASHSISGDGLSHPSKARRVESTCSTYALP